MMQAQVDLPATPGAVTRALRNFRNERVLAAIGIVAAITVAVRVVSVFRELLVARAFGVGDALDAFVIAYLLPSFAVTVVAGSMTAALVPTYIDARERRGPKAAEKLLSGVLFVSLSFVGLMTVILASLIPILVPTLASGFAADKLLLTKRLAYVLLPLVSVNGVSAVLSGVLNAGERFAAAALTPIVTPVVVVVFTLALAASWGPYALAVGFVVGAVGELVVLYLALGKRGIPVRPHWVGWDNDLRMVAAQYAPMVVGTLLMSSTLLIDQAMAATLGSGSVSALNYGSRLVTLFTGIGAIAVGTVVTPYFSLMISHEDWRGVRSLLRRYLGLIFVLTLPVTVSLCAFSEPIIHVLLERGAFSPSDTARVSTIQALFAIQIPFYVGGILVVRLISCLRVSKVLMWGCAINAALNVTLNYLLMRLLGVAGIALSTSLVYVTAFSFLLTIAVRQIRTRTAAETSNPALAGAL